MAPQSTNAPYYDSVTTYGHGSRAPQSVSAPYFDSLGLWAPSSTIGTPTDGLVVKLSGAALTSFDRSWRDELQGPGSFSLSVPNDLTVPAFGDVLTFEIDEIPRFAGVVEAKNIVTYDPGEGAAEITKVSGRGRLAVTNGGLIRPSRGVDAEPVERTRTLSWVSVDFDDTAWGYAKRIRRTDQPTPYSPYRAMPEWWPDKTAYWVWANRSDVNGADAPAGKCLFRSDPITLAEGTHEILFGLNNLGVVYFDGARLGDISNAPPDGTRVRFDVSAGDHTIAARVTNYIRDGGFTWAIYTVDNDGLLDTLVASCDNDNTRCLPYPTVIPGFTPGEAIRVLLEECQAAAYNELDNVTLDFTDDVDSDGQVWTEAVEITVEVGRKFMEFLESISDWLVDVQMAPGANVLRAWNWGTRGSTPGVTIAATTDPTTSEVLAASHDGRDVRANHLLVAYKNGLVEVEDATSVAANGRIPDFVDLGDVQTSEVATRIGQSLLELRKDAEYASILALAPVSSTPYEAFDNGDTITHPNEAGTTSASRVQGITVNEDTDDGFLSYGIEVNDVRSDERLRHDNWLKRFNMGSLAGGARVAGKSGEPLPAPVKVSSKNVAEFSFDNSALVASYSPKRPADSSGNLIEIYAELTTAGTTTTTVRVYKNGVQLGADLTFASGVTSAEVDLSTAKCYRNVDIFQARIVTAGTGAEGLDVQVRAI